MAEIPDNEIQQQIDCGFAALLQGKWEEATQIFDRLLQQDPHSGMACLGRVMAEKEIHGRAELAENWDWLCQDEQFQNIMADAKPDFLPWLQQDMTMAREVQQYSSAEESVLPDFSGMSLGRKIFLIFAGVQVMLYLLVMALLWKANADTSTGTFVADLVAMLVVSAMITGLPMILGLLYGNSIINVGRFCKLLRVLNNIVAIAGGGLLGMVSVAGCMSLQEGTVVEPSERYYLTVFIVAFIIHLLSLVIPIILNKVEYDL